MSPVSGEVKGSECPGCGCSLELNEFWQGQEVDCPCGAVLHIDSVEAVYTIKLTRLDLPEEPAS